MLFNKKMGSSQAGWPVRLCIDRSGRVNALHSQWSRQADIAWKEAWANWRK